MKAIETLQEYSNLAGPVFLRPEDTHTPQQTAVAEWVKHGGRALTDDELRHLYSRLYGLHFDVKRGGLPAKYCIAGTAREIFLKCPKCGGRLAKVEFKDENTHGYLVFCLDCLEEIYIFSSNPKRLIERVIRYDAVREMANRIDKLNEMDLSVLKIDSSLLKRLTDGGFRKIEDIWWEIFINGVQLGPILETDELKRIGIEDEEQEEAKQITAAILEVRNSMMEDIVRRISVEYNEDESFGTAIYYL